MEVPLRDAREVRVSATADWLREQHVCVVLNVHSLHIVHPRVLDAATLGSYNLHPGPLPEWAGLYTPSWALYEGAERYGVTLHRMTPQVDAGPIAFADSFDIDVTDTALAVMMQCVRRGMRLIERLLEVAERGEEIPARPQDLSRQRRFGAGPPQDGRLDWNLSAGRITNFVRACDYRPFASPWGFPRCTADGRDVSVLTAQVGEGPVNVPPGTVAHGDGGAVRVASSDAWVHVNKVRVDGRTFAAAEILQDGTRLR